MNNSWKTRILGGMFFIMCFLLTGIAGAASEEKEILYTAITEKTEEDFIVGASIVNSELSDDNLMNLVTTHFNAVTLGNELKPDAMFFYSSVCPGTEATELNGEELVVPKMDFARPETALDVIKAWNKEHPEHIIKVRGHVLVWHSQTPEWFFCEDYDAKKPYVSKEEMNKRLEWYIKTMAEHFTGEDSPYYGMFYAWDVVNEAVSDSSGTYRSANENSSWWRLYQSNEFIINAFRFANKYMDPSIDLYYNDYNEWYAGKKKGILQLIEDVKSEEGTRLDGMGMQGHYATESDPSVSDFMNAARAYAEVVDKIQVTELDLKASSKYKGGSEGLQEEYELQARRYSDLYHAVLTLKEEGLPIEGITFWGVIDPNSWLQTFNQVGGASDGKKRHAPLLFDGAYQKKPAFYAFTDSDQTASVKSALTISKVDQGGGLSGCMEYSMNCSDAGVTIKPSYNGKGIGFKVTVSDKQKTEGDKVTLYLKKEGSEEILMAEKTRAEGITNGSGYDVVVFIPLGAEELSEGTEYSFELVITNRGKTDTFSGAEWKGELSEENLTACILG